MNSKDSKEPDLKDGPDLTHFIDLNCDMGEGVGNDEQIMPFISSSNIACGYHAGDEITMWMFHFLIGRISGEQKWFSLPLRSMIS